MSIFALPKGTKEYPEAVQIRLCLMSNNLKSKKKMERKVVKNCHFIGVKACCASCCHRMINDDGFRVCTKKKRFVYKTNCCDSWKLSRGLNRPRARWGKVKNPDYLKYMARIRAMENARIVEAEEKGMYLEMLSAETIRRTFEKVHGEIYREL